MSFRAAPEVLATRGSASYTNKVDVWSLGVILYVCLVGYPPFSESPDGPSLTDQILKGLYTFPAEFWSDVSDTAKDLIRQMMCVDPSKRLSMAGVLDHPWLAADLENTDRVQKIMYPTVVPTKTSNKRAASNDGCSSMDDAMDTPATESISRKQLKKRVKY